MATKSFKLQIDFSKNDGLILSPSNLVSMYMPGIPLCYPGGGSISSKTIEQKIRTATKQIENFLSIKIQKQMIEENHDFNKQEFSQWGYIKTNYPIVFAEKLEGRINNISQIKYPKSWLSIKSKSDSTSFRNLHIIPNVDGAQEMNQYSVVYSGISPVLGYFGGDYIPNYWNVTYCTGWDSDEIPSDILDAIGKLATMQILAITGDLIFGAGIGNQNISIDGVSQSYSTTKGGGKGAFSGRIDMYKQELEQNLLDLKAEYVGIRLRAM